ncbi:MAG TPA: SAF domain-containing protein [Pseudonocardia sp.]|jgi:Flp pilus assembly protein CpaB|uniref:SAF domain-containing protein n=1 Tax=Pseudonocardia sp. TaxID=60912 RepID=UPI002F41141F
MDITQPHGNASARPGERVGRLAIGFGWRRMLLARRVLAGVLVALAMLIALRPADGRSATLPVLVAVHELAPGSTVHTADLQVHQWPPELVPANALTEVAQADGRVLAGAASTGEPLTEPRLAGPALAKQATGRADATSVPIRLADAEVAGLLGPGQLVDVITQGERTNRPTVLASAAVVLTVLPAQAKAAGGKGRLVLVAVPRSVATAVAAATLGQDVAVTLR